jgi:hypothetical protein
MRLLPILTPVSTNHAPHSLSPFRMKADIDYFKSCGADAVFAKVCLYMYF